MADALVTECCCVAIQAERRFCPKCGYECRVLESAPAGDAIDPVGEKVTSGPRAGESSSLSDSVRLTQLREGLHALIASLRKRHNAASHFSEWHPKAAQDLKDNAAGQAYATEQCADDLAALLAASDGTPK